MRLFFLGWYDRGNCGDEAFKDVHRQLFGDHDLAWICDRPPPLQSGDRLVLGGGDVFSPCYLEHFPATRTSGSMASAWCGEVAALNSSSTTKHRISPWEYALRNRSDAAPSRLRFVVPAKSTIHACCPASSRQACRESLPSSETRSKRARDKKLYVICRITWPQGRAPNRQSWADRLFSQFMKQQIGYAVNALRR